MKTFEQKLVMLLSDPQLTDAQFRDAARLLTGERLYRTIRAAEELRSHMRHLFRNGREEEVDDDLYLRLKSLLLTESGMKPIDALRALARELDLNEQFPAKSSFRKGLARLLQSGDGSALLSAAERIRERASEETTEHAWPLSKGGALESGGGSI
jgi:hypothetical protein